MQVKIISETVPVCDEIPSGKPEDLLVYIARVSNPKNQANFKTGSGLLRYCIREEHWSPFEQVDCTFEIKTTRDIGRQVLRHVSFRFQEFSQRYAIVETDTFEFREARLQDVKNRQNSLRTDNQELKDGWITFQKKVAQVAATAYKWAIENGIAKEQARAVLPEGLTPSVMYVKGSLRSWIHYVELRSGNGTQLEHQEIAVEIKHQLMKRYEFLNDHWKSSEGVQV